MRSGAALAILSRDKAEIRASVFVLWWRKMKLRRFRPAHCISAGTPWGRIRSRGATIVEFALILPLILGILLGILEFGWMIKNYLTLANATREGARIASVGRTIAETKSRITGIGSPLVFDPNTGILLEYSANEGATYFPWPSDINGRNGVDPGKLIRVTCTTQNRSLTGALPVNRNLRVSVVIRREP